MDLREEESNERLYQSGFHPNFLLHQQKRPSSGDTIDKNLYRAQVFTEEIEDCQMNIEISFWTHQKMCMIKNFTQMLTKIRTPSWGDTDSRNYRVQQSTVLICRGNVPVFFVGECMRRTVCEGIHFHNPSSLNTIPAKELACRCRKLPRPKVVHEVNGRETSRSEAPMRSLFRKSHVQSSTSEERTDRNALEEINPVLLQKFFTEDQPSTEMNESIPKSRTKPTANTKLNMIIYSENEASNYGSKEDEPVDDEFFRIARKLQMMPFRRE